MVTRDELRSVLPTFVTAKVLTVGAMVVSLAQSGTLGWQALRGAFLHWDALAYVDIAAHGYTAHLDYHDAFLPGYPLLMRAVSTLTGDLVTAGIVVSAAAELVALVLIARLVRRERDERTARFAVWAVALLPLAFFLTGLYTESAFIAGAAGAILAMRSGHFASAALAAAFATAMRLTGVVLVPVLLLEMCRQKRLRRDGWWLAVAVLPLLLYGAYMQLRTGDSLALLHAEALPSFGESIAWPWDGLRLTWETAATADDPTTRAIFIREIAAGLIGVAVVAAAWLDARFPRSLALYCTLVLLTAVCLTFWRSVPRYDLALFPAVIVLADATRRIERVRPLLLAAGAAGVAWGAFVFAEGGWVG